MNINRAIRELEYSLKFLKGIKDSSSWVRNDISQAGIKDWIESLPQPVVIFDENTDPESSPL